MSSEASDYQLWNSGDSIQPRRLSSPRAVAVTISLQSSPYEGAGFIPPPPNKSLQLEHR
ncbi:hypothetical protein ACRRTK_009858 [Alexandromys fortis]